MQRKAASAELRFKLAPLVLGILGSCASTQDPSALPPQPLEEGLLVEPSLDYDLASAREKAAWLRTHSECDHAYRVPVMASNTRGENARFAPSALTDGDDATYWTTDDLVTHATATLEFGEATTFDHVVLKEREALGRRIGDWSLAVRPSDGDSPEWIEVARGFSVGPARVVTLEPTTTDALRLSIQAEACPVVESIEVYSLAKSGATR